MLNVNAEVPECMEFLFKPARYKVAYGGRGGAKSWGFATAAVIKAISQTTRFLCTREIQNSIKESVHRLLVDTIERLDLSKFFDIRDNGISCQNGSEFIFKGLYRNQREIKSLEGVNVCWVEEAENVSKESWDILLPTIRKDDSEIWIGFNTKYEDDETYKRFVLNPPKSAIVKKVNFFDNPYFPKTLDDERLECLSRDPTGYKNIWLGEPIGAGAKIWTPYDEAIHVRDFDIKEIAKRGNCFMAMDPHSKFYPFCVWVALIPKNGNEEEFYRVIYNEWPTVDAIGGHYHDLRKSLYFNGSLKDLAREIYALDGTAEYGIKINKRFIDTRFAKGAGGENWSTSTVGIVQEFSRAENGGLVFDMPPERAIDAQRSVIIEQMRYNTLQARSVFNEPDLIVMPHCKNVRASLANHRCVEGSEKEDEKYKDPSDALRITWAGMADWKYKDPKAPKQTLAHFTGAGAENGWLA